MIRQNKSDNFAYLTFTHWLSSGSGLHSPFLNNPLPGNLNVSFVRGLRPKKHTKRTRITTNAQQTLSLLAVVCTNESNFDAWAIDWLQLQIT